MANISAMDIANYFLASVDEDSGDNISNLKLQKLLYYAQGFYVAIAGRPLFSEDILAWGHGPVVPAVYHAFKEYGSNAIPCGDFDFTVFDPDMRELLDEVFQAYGQYSAWKLRDMTHDEAPWKYTPRNTVISLDAMREFFKTRLTNG